MELLSFRTVPRVTTVDPLEAAGRDQQLAHVARAFTDAARAAGEAPRDGATTDYTDLRPDGVRDVWVFAHDGWHLGELAAYRRRADAWEGHVRWSEGVAQQHIDWLPQDRIRPLSGNQ